MTFPPTLKPRSLCTRAETRPVKLRPERPAGLTVVTLTNGASSRTSCSFGLQAASASDPTKTVRAARKIRFEDDAKLTAFRSDHRPGSTDERPLKAAGEDPVSSPRVWAGQRMAI